MSDSVGATVQSFLDESRELDRLVAGLTDDDWEHETPAAGWTIAHQIAHLHWTDRAAILAATDRAGFDALLADAGRAPLEFVDRAASAGVIRPYGELLARWRSGRDDLAHALREADPTTKLPWFGPPMSPRSMATARLMETWAHGQDVADTLGVRHEPTNRLRDVCHLGVRTRDFAYRINGFEPPADEFRIELTGPDGQQWSWGPADAGERVTGSAEDFCLVVAQRREPAATDLVATAEARRWLEFAQVFAGAPKSAVRGRAQR